MAEDGTLGVQRASIAKDDFDEPSKEELQRRMEEARETITQTVTEIKETVTNQYHSMKETVSDALDWRHHFRKNPIAFSVGALSVGFLVGYGLAGTVRGNGRGRDDYPSSEESDVYARTGATPLKYEDERDYGERHSAFHGHSYAAQPITDRPYETPDDERRPTYEDEEGEVDDYRQPQGGSYSYSGSLEEREDTSKKPSLLERFKTTSAYDRLQTEVSSLGDRFIEELSSTAQTVVLPALFNKIKELFGVDLSNKQGQESQGKRLRQAGTSPNTAARAASASGGSPSAASASRGSAGSSYASSENRGYGAQSNARETGRGSDASSVLDPDR
jgi:hypothetical protein